MTIVSDGQRLRADLARAGDEPLLLARSLPGVAVLVCADRFLAGRLAEQHLGATVHVLDDGFQHMQLARDVNLLIVDRADVERPRLLPSGPPARAAVGRACGRCGAGDREPRANRSPTSPTGWAWRIAFALHRDVEPAVEETVDGPQTAGYRRTGRWSSAASRGPSASWPKPSRAASTWPASRLWRPPSLRRPPTSSASRSRCAPRSASIVLTTEKDFVRMLPLRPWPFQLAVRPMSVRVEPAEQFAAWLLERVHDSGLRLAPSPGRRRARPAGGRAV